MNVELLTPLADSGSLIHRATPLGGANKNEANEQNQYGSLRGGGRGF